ncbi:MAG: outer membrane protein assembly factor BamA [Zetaproteobacteria bacterium CG12_big_fil_rev_8_21_14_0_65_54_13]|nr:MAG: outer membrane protein assembly factor BamA [Zetaproteobacteria bacterium CG12_big_fil_rev_8_21_14_0_65_54_13]
MTGFVRLLSMMLVLGSCICCLPILSSAADGSSEILSIEVEGNQYVEKQAVLARMVSKIGQQLDRKNLSRDVRKLYKSGFFSDIRFTGTRTGRGIDLVCHVKEYPLIAKLAIEGNDEHSTKDLQKKMKLKPGAFFNPDNQQADRNVLRKGYLKDGFYQNDVQFVSTPTKDGRVDVVVKIHEGKVTRISRVRFIGNHAFSDSQLRGAVASRQTDLVNTVMKSDVFNKQKFGADVQLLQQYYLNHGYLDMKVDSEQLTLATDKTSFTLTFSVHEGIQYIVDQLDVQGDVVPDKAALMELVELEHGEPYSLESMSRTIQAITDRVGDEGYAFASVTPLLKRDIDAHTVSIAFDIDKGRKVYVERIEISGNEKTEDVVLRRLIRQSEGSLYQGVQVKHTREELGRAVMVEDVRVSLDKTGDSNRVNMKIDVKEQKTGSLSGGIGYSQREKVILTAKISENNLFGKGYQTNLNGQLGKVTQNLTGNFLDPHFLDSDISASVNLTKVKTDPITTITYRTDKIAGGVGFGVPITLNLAYGISYNYSDTNLTGIPVTASNLIRAQEGRTTIGEVSQSISWDSRDRLTSTRSGHFDMIRFAVAGLGGRSKFWEASASSALYVPLDKPETYVLNPSIEYNMIRPLAGQDVPLWRRYSLGGIGSLRGFDANGVSLRDLTTSEALGGDRQLRASTNLFFPLPYMQTSGFRGLVFADAGMVWGQVRVKVGNAVLTSIPEKFAFSRMRYSVGVGLEWLSPIGPVGFSWAFPLRTLPGDVVKNFEFALGTQF